MRRAFHLTLIFTVAAAMMSPAFAQDKKKKRKGKKNDPKSAVMNLIKDVELTDEQKPKIEAIAKEFGPKLRESYEKKMKVLTDEQKKAQVAARKKSVEAKKAGKKIKQSEAQKELLAALKLTEEQKKKWDAAGKENNDIRKKALAKIAEVLTDEQKQKVQGLKAKKGGKGKGKGKKKKKDDADK